MKKILIISLLFVVLASAFFNCFAFEKGTKTLKSLEKIEDYLAYKGIPKHVQYVVYEENGKTYPAYCINPEYYGVGVNGNPNSYNVNCNSKITNQMIWRVIINGYPYKSLSELGVETPQEAYTATQYAIYTIINNTEVEDHSSLGGSAADRAYNAYKKIVSSAKASTESINNSIVSILSQSEEWKVDSSLENYISKNYKVSSVVNTGDYTVNLSGELPNGIKITDINNNEVGSFGISDSFKILIPIGSLEKNGSFDINITANIATKPVLFGETTIAGTQNYAITGPINEKVTSSLKEKYSENITKIEIIKKEYGTENKLEGVKFNLLNSNKAVIKENLITDENGELKIEKLLPGKYYIQEKETLEGYNLYQDLIEVNIKLNEEVQVIVNNTVKSSSTVTDVNEIVEVVPQYTETAYNVENSTTLLNSNNIKKLPVTGF